ncbi:MAG: anti-sigma F factor [Thermoanaerobacteraceae bacterium]|nr:anti-sigma F factor [Thermoanaerobacteraceae bacterium]
MGKLLNKVTMEFSSIAENVGLARVTVASVASQADLTLNDLEEIKVATSEAVSNAIIHGYENRRDGRVKLEISRFENWLEIVVDDKGKGIENIQQAMEPTYSSDPERMGLGFVFMKSFMDDLEVKSEPGQGTVVIMRKRLTK